MTWKKVWPTKYSWIRLTIRAEFWSRSWLQLLLTNIDRSYLNLWTFFWYFLSSCPQQFATSKPRSSFSSQPKSEEANALYICTWFLKNQVWEIKFEKSSSTNWIFNLQKSISKLIFAGYTGSKNSVWNRLKIQFIELDFSNLVFQKYKVQINRATVKNSWILFFKSHKPVTGKQLFCYSWTLLT